jgi:SNF2 family DNA or RNA helicase
MPGFLGDVRSFNARWRKPIEENGETLRAQLLSQRVRPFILRRRKQDVATELPPRTETILRVQLQGKQRELYEAVRPPPTSRCAAHWSARALKARKSPSSMPC